ncbi:hypothetical protein GCM10009575_042210 [Streptomyces rhizosphaericus]|uniref:Uncharacterized protein n=1 Tax=Streptomyces rhizosphaericus TaxID=114699 RepID=A0ABP4AAN3_9ACTN
MSALRLVERVARELNAHPWDNPGEQALLEPLFDALLGLARQAGCLHGPACLHITADIPVVDEPDHGR